MCSVNMNIKNAENVLAFVQASKNLECPLANMVADWLIFASESSVWWSYPTIYNI